MVSRAAALSIAALLLAGTLVLAYANHFDNGFYFDDAHTVVNNLWIRDLANIDEFFSNPETTSTLPPNRQYRPLVTLSLAIDYWLGGGLEPFWFHLSTFIWYALQLALMFFVLRRLFTRADPRAPSDWIALFAVGWYGLHAANAETINYVIARSDALSTAAVVAALAVYQFTEGRRRLLVVVPLVIGGLVKPTAAMFAPLLVAYIWIIEKQGRPGDYLRDRGAVAVTVASFAACFGTYGMVSYMTPPSFSPGDDTTLHYAMTQPLVLLHYVGNFLAPLQLSADTDWRVLESAGDPLFAIGLAFLLALLAVVWQSWPTPERQTMAPVAFGVVWFLLALAPTSSLVPLAEVLNDHRTFFPYIGLVTAGAWALWQAAGWLRQRAPWLAGPVAVGTLACLLIGSHAYGTFRRNQVWHDDASLWHDVTLKSPRNGRGLMNYGLSQMRRGEYDRALDYFTRALEVSPRYAYLHINLGVLKNAMGRLDESEDHFRQALEYRPGLATGYFYYGDVLRKRGRMREARDHLEHALQLSPGMSDARYSLMELHQAEESWEALRELAEDTLRVAPSDARAQAFLEASETGRTRLTSAEEQARARPSPENWLRLSLQYHRAGRFADSLDAARESVALRPDYAAAHNNVAAAQIELGDWDAAVAAGTRALTFDPELELARNNLARARRLADAAARAGVSSDASELLDISLLYFREGFFTQCIAICQRVVELAPQSVVAYNNICSAYNELGAWSLAISACRAALRIDPDFALASNNLRQAEQGQAADTR